MSSLFSSFVLFAKLAGTRGSTGWQDEQFSHFLNSIMWLGISIGLATGVTALLLFFYQKAVQNKEKAKDKRQDDLGY
jgi:hypothetical protein